MAPCCIHCCDMHCSNGSACPVASLESEAAEPGTGAVAEAEVSVAVDEPVNTLMTSGTEGELPLMSEASAQPPPGTAAAAALTPQSVPSTCPSPPTDIKRMCIS